MGKKLTVVSVKCIKPSSAIDDVARGIFGAIGGVIGGVASGAATVASGGVLVATVGVAAVGGASAGVAVIEGLDRVFAGEDELYVKVNGRKVWPGGKSEDIDSQESKDINYTTDLNQNVNIELWEWDMVSSDDHMGTLTIRPEHQAGEFTYAVAHEGEGSLYNITVRIS